jgi:hypothetical protein
MQVHEWVSYLRARLVTHRGLVVDDKKYSVTIHYRRIRDKTRVRQAIANAVRALSHFRGITGSWRQHHCRQECDCDQDRQAGSHCRTPM